MSTAIGNVSWTIVTIIYWQPDPIWPRCNEQVLERPQHFHNRHIYFYIYTYNNKKFKQTIHLLLDNYLFGQLRNFFPPLATKNLFLILNLPVSTLVMFLTFSSTFTFLLISSYLLLFTIFSPYFQTIFLFPLSFVFYRFLKQHFVCVSFWLLSNDKCLYVSCN